MQLFSSRNTPIGLDIRHDGIYATQYRLAGGKPLLHAAVAYPIIESPGVNFDQALLNALQKLARGPFRGREVIAVLPRMEADIRRLQMSCSAETDYPRFIEEIQVKARQSLLYPPEEAVLDFLPLGSFVEDQQQLHIVMLIAARRKQVFHYLNLIQSAGLKCIHLDVSPCAAARAFEHEITTAIIDIDLPCTVISVCQGPNLLFSRTVRFGLSALHDSLTEELTLEPGQARQMLRLYGLRENPQARCAPQQIPETGEFDQGHIPGLLYNAAHRALDQFSREVKRSLDYVMHQNHAIFGRGPWVGGPVEKAVLIGSQLPAGLAQFLESALTMPVNEIDPFHHQSAAALPAHPVAYTVASGLALRKLAA